AHAGGKFAGESLYQLDIPLTDQGGQQIKLDTFRGKPVLISMFYASCPHVCPLIINNIQKTEQALEAELRKDLRVILVSLDPQKATPEFLSEIANRQKVDLHRWKLTRASDADVRKLAAVLGLRYRRLPDGEFNHSTLITLLDPNGVPVASSELLSEVDTNF